MVTLAVLSQGVSRIPAKPHQSEVDPPKRHGLHRSLDELGPGLITLASSISCQSRSIELVDEVLWVSEDLSATGVQEFGCLPPSAR
jgi:hypothetical protein